MIRLTRHSQFLTPEAEIARRVTRLQTALQEQGIGLAYFDHPPDLFYFSGSDQAGTLLVPAQGAAIYFARKSCARAEVESPLKVAPFPGRKGLLAAVAERLSPGKTLGLPLDVTLAATYVWLSGNLEDCRIEDLSGVLRLQKAVKSAWEIAQIRSAADQTTTLFTEVPRLLRVGMPEIEFAAAVEGRMRVLGHGGPLRIRRQGANLGMHFAVAGDAALYPTNFDGPVGGEGPYPVGAAGSGRRPIGAEETLLLDIASSHNGYHADNARTFFLGPSVPAVVRDAHRFCLDIIERIEEGLRPGVNCAALYEEVLAWGEDRGEPEGFMGYGENRVRFLGHGIGVELDEFPVIAAKVDLDLAAGMVVAVEPKAFLRGFGGVGLENTYVITPDGAECLCPTARDIVCVG